MKKPAAAKPIDLATTVAQVLKVDPAHPGTAKLASALAAPSAAVGEPATPVLARALGHHAATLPVVVVQAPRRGAVPQRTHAAGVTVIVHPPRGKVP